jgi:hypothetical protein
MGSFYSTCSASSMTLVNQKTSILLLTPNAESFSEHLNMIVSNDGCQAFFSPFGFPIHGTYYDYGYIENIKRDKNVEMLEQFFGIDIQTILKGIGREIHKGTKNPEIYKTLGMTYFRTEVLEYLERGWDKYNLDNPQKYSSGSFISDLIKSLDKSKIISDDEYYKLLEKRINKTITDEERELMHDYITSNARTQRTYVSSFKNSMFRLLPINSDFKEEILKQYTMLRTLGFELRKTLIPSEYGSQDSNWTQLYKFNDFVNDLLVEDIKHWYEDGVDGEEAEVLRLHGATIRDRKINSIL